jgi:hypothetical protein
MGRSLARIIVLAPLALLAACAAVTPRSSVPFQAAAEREMRYAAEATLAVKENRRDEVSEAAANGRVVLPQMPEIWASSPADEVRERALEPDQVAVVAAGAPAATIDPAACAWVWWDGRDAEGCPGRAPGAGPELPPLFPAAIAPTAGSEPGSAAGPLPDPRAWPLR